MRLTTLETESGHRVVAVRADGTFIDLAAIDASIPNSMIEFMADSDWQRKAEAAISSATEQHTIAGRRLAPVPRPGKVICIGLNYRDHAEESGLDIPSEPVCFSKFSTAVTGPDQPIVIPQVCKTVDYEAELVIVIGKTSRNLTTDTAADAVAGYTVGHDVSARDWQIGRPGSQWLLGKTPDTFAPIGPDIVTADEVKNPHDLGISLRVNGKTMQDSSTSAFIFTVEEILVHLSQLMTLEPGDIIFTGTPPGVGMARKPPVWLQPGDEVEVEIEGLGVLKNSVVAEG